jgi:uncharacterized membrane protein
MDTSIEKLVASGLLGALVGYALHKSAAVGALAGVGSALVIDQYMSARTARIGRPAPTVRGRTLVLNRKLPAAAAAALARARGQSTAGKAPPNPQYDMQYQQQSQQQAQQPADQGQPADDGSQAPSDWEQQVSQEDQMAWVGNEALDPIERALWSMDRGGMGETYRQLNQPEWMWR